MKTLIIGGRGFIGSHLAPKIKADVIDIEEDFLHWTPRKYKKIYFLAADLDFTLGAYLYNKKLYQKLDEYMELYPNTHVVYTSSAFVYGDNIFASEDSPLNATHIYGQSKLLGEYYIRRYKNHSILRLSNVYGDGGHSAIDKFLEGSNQIHGDGLQVRDFVPVEYVVDALIKSPKGIYNISSGVGLSILRVYALFGSKKPIFIKKDAGLRHIVLDNKKYESLNTR